MFSFFSKKNRIEEKIKDIHANQATLEIHCLLLQMQYNTPEERKRIMDEIDFTKKDGFSIVRLIKNL